MEAILILDSRSWILDWGARAMQRVRCSQSAIIADNGSRRSVYPKSEIANPKSLVAALSPTISRLAVVCPSWVGDTVMCTSVLRAIRQHLPQARIAAICRPGLDQLLAGCPFVDSTLVCDM